MIVSPSSTSPFLSTYSGTPRFGQRSSRCRARGERTRRRDDSRKALVETNKTDGRLMKQKHSELACGSRIQSTILRRVSKDTSLYCSRVSKWSASRRPTERGRGPREEMTRSVMPAVAGAKDGQRNAAASPERRSFGRGPRNQKNTFRKMVTSRCMYRQYAKKAKEPSPKRGT